MPLLQLRHKGKADQQNGHRVKGVEHRDGQPQDVCQAQVRDQHTGSGKKSGKGRVGHRGHQGVEVLPHTGNEAHTGVKAGQHKNSGKEHKACFAKKPVCQHCQHIGSGGKAGDGGPGKGSGVAQHGVHRQQQPSGHKPGQDGAALHLLLPGDALGLDVQGNDGSKVQGCQGVHGLVAVQYAL